MSTEPRPKRTLAHEAAEASPGEGGALSIALLVAPNAGRLRILTPESFHGGREWVEAGQVIVEIERTGQRDLIASPVRGRLGGMMGSEGQPVKAGQAVAWVEPA